MERNRTYGWTKARWDDEPVIYCVRCGSLNIQGFGKDIHCENCHSHPKYLDISNIHKYMKWYEESFGHSPLAKEPTIYDDLCDVYQEEATEAITDSEALDNGLNVGNWTQRNLHEK